nr:Mu transposase C-terminal domain-containing protein [Microvirga arsenatis]
MPAEQGRTVLSDEPPADPAATAKAWLLIRRLTATGIHVGGRRYQDPGLAALRAAGADTILVRVDPSDPSCIAVQEPSGRWMRIAACQGCRDRGNGPKG